MNDNVPPMSKQTNQAFLREYLARERVRQLGVAVARRRVAVFLAALLPPLVHQRPLGLLARGQVGGDHPEAQQGGGHQDDAAVVGPGF